MASVHSHNTRIWLKINICYSVEGISSAFNVQNLLMNNFWQFLLFDPTIILCWTAYKKLCQLCHSIYLWPQVCAIYLLLEYDSLCCLNSMKIFTVCTLRDCKLKVGSHSSLKCPTSYLWILWCFVFCRSNVVHDGPPYIHIKPGHWAATQKDCSHGY